MRIRSILVYSLLFFSYTDVLAKIPREKLLAAYIFKLIDHIQWISKLDQYNLYVDDDGSEIYEHLVDASRLKKGHNKKIAVFKIAKGEIPNSAHIVFISRKSSLNYLALYKKTELNPILLISDRIDDDRHTLIDIQNNANYQLTFKINKSNIIHRKLKIDPEIIFLGGTEIDVAQLYKKGQDDIQKQSKHIKTLNNEVVIHKKNTAQVLNNLKQTENKITLRNETIKNQAQEIYSQQLTVNDLITKTERQREAIKKNTSLLKQRELALSSLQTQINKSKSILSKQHFNIGTQKKKIDSQYSYIYNQQELINNQVFTINTQKKSLYLIAFSLLISLLLMLISFYAYRQKKITNAKLLEYTKHLAKARKDAEIYANTKSTFLSCMSHELRSPLTSIIGFSQLMKSESSFSDKAKENIAIINHSGNHLLALINDILDLSKIESGQIEFNNEVIYIANICNDIIKMFQVNANNKQLYLRLELTPSCHERIYTDATKLRRLLINLISNAIKFTSEGGITIYVHCVSSANESQVELQIKIEDTGMGVSPTDQDKIFKPFEQANIDQNTNWKAGTGLGLSICKQLVELMNGSIQLSSLPGLGSIFSFSIIVGKVLEEDITMPGDNPLEVIGFESPTTINILIVEDLEDSAYYLSQVLQKIGCNSSIAEDGQQAILAYEQYNPDLIFMDKRMPKVNGIKAAQSIRKLEGGDNVIIIATTASAFDDIKENILDRTFDDFIQKPYSSNDIYRCLKKYLGIKLVYSESTIDNVTPDTNKHDVMKKALFSLSEQTKSDLQTAILELDIEKTLAAIERVKQENVDLSVYLTGFLDTFNFSSLKNLCDFD
ncbi:MAG: DUF4154 domain-containing protein [Methylococcales bacterium]|nr:DUF4154 domain-containing protein [Methylococcales bacterium]